MSIESKTKEAVIKANLLEPSKGTGVLYNDRGFVINQPLYKAMDEWAEIVARSRAIEFKIWCKKNTQLGYYYKGKLMDESQLYELFSQQIDNHSIDK